MLMGNRLFDDFFFNANFKIKIKNSKSKQKGENLLELEQSMFIGY